MKGDIKVIEDIGAPLAVTVVNIMARASTKTLAGMSYSEALSYIMTLGGYVGAYMGWGGSYKEFVKNVAIASAPLSFDKLYSRIKGVATSSHPMAMRVSRYPGPAAESPFQGVRLV
jgi:hypothetical protein